MTQSHRPDLPKQGGRRFQTVLVDTSLLIEQQKGADRAQRVQSALSRYSFMGASSYSKLEVKRAWIQRLAYIYSMCGRPNVASVADVHEVINKQLSDWRNRRRVQTCMEAMESFLRQDGANLSDRASLARLRVHCKSAALSAWAALQHMITGEFNGTGCVRAAEPPREKRDGSLDVTIRRCKPEDTQCTVHTFFEEHLPTFRSLARFIDGNEGCSPELLHMRDHIRRAEENLTHLCNNQHCCKLADMLIAVDGRKMDEFAANNDAEWRPISKILGKPLINPVKETRFEP